MQDRVTGRGERLRCFEGSTLVGLISFQRSTHDPRGGEPLGSSWKTWPLEDRSGPSSHTHGRHEGWRWFLLFFNEPKQDAPLPLPSTLLPSTQVSSSTSVALLTETSLSWKPPDRYLSHLHNDSTIAFKGTKHKLTPQTCTHTHTLQLSSTTSAVF